MLDIKFIRENFDLVAKSTKEKGYQIDLKELIKLDDARKATLIEVEALRTRRNEIAAKMKGGKPDPALIEEGKSIKQTLAEKESALTAAEEKVRTVLKSVPNVIFDDVPLGGEEDSKEIKKWGENHATGVDHLDYATSREILLPQKRARPSRKRPFSVRPI